MNIGQKILRLDTVDSTNNYTANLLIEGKLESGTVILADEQTAGRGQRGSQWSSNAGENLLFTLFIEPDNMSVEDQQVLTHFASVSLINILRKIGISALIKWPNDIFVNDKKIAGILIENNIRGGNISSSIIGIGLNVNQGSFNLLSATSVKNETDNFYSINEILFLLIQEMNSLWKEIEKCNFQKLRSEYLDNLYLIDQLANFSDMEGNFKGIIKGVTQEGYLLIEKNSELKKYDLKEIRFISQNDL